MAYDSKFILEEVATEVVERFDRVYDPAKISSAMVESQMECQQVSKGWWLVIKRLGIALWIGNDKPGIETGDLLTITIAKKDLPAVRRQTNGAEAANGL